jgi:hypothetical protein
MFGEMKYNCRLCMREEEKELGGDLRYEVKRSSG